MSINRVSFVSLVICVAMLASTCAKSAHQTGQDQLDKLVPSDVMAKVDETVSFADLRLAPSNYVGRTVMISGLALNAHRIKDGTEIEILQLPTERGLTPSDRKSKSEGRFLAVQSAGFLDPAVIEKDSPLTVIGEVKGATTKRLDDGEYQIRCSTSSTSSIGTTFAAAIVMDTMIRAITAGTVDITVPGRRGTTGSAVHTMVLIPMGSMVHGMGSHVSRRRHRRLHLPPFHRSFTRINEDEAQRY